MKSVRHIAFIAALLLVFTTIDGKAAGKGKDIKIDSPDKHTTVAIDGKKLTFAITHDGMTLVTNASIGLTTSDRTDINHVTMPGVKHRVSEHIDAPFYRQSHFTATCNEMELKLNDGFSVVFRVYDDGVAYRFNYNENYAQPVFACPNFIERMNNIPELLRGETSLRATRHARFPSDHRGHERCQGNHP